MTYDVRCGCGRLLAFVAEGEVLASFKQCPRHPHRQRFDDETGDLVRLSRSQVKRDEMLVHVMLSDLRAARQKGRTFYLR